MSLFTKDEEKYVKSWLVARAAEFFLQKNEKNEEARVGELWDFIKDEAKMVSGEYLERKGGDKFTVFMAQNCSDLVDLYPNLLHDAKMSLTRQQEDRERRAQRKRKVYESAGGSAAGESAAGESAAGESAAGGSAAGGNAARGSAAGGSAAGESAAGGSAAGGNAARGSAAGGSAAGGNASKRYRQEIEALKKDKDDLQSQVSALTVEVQVTTSMLEQITDSHERLLSDHRGLIGTKTNLSESEMDELLKQQEFYHKRLANLRAQMDVEKGAAETLLEEDPKNNFVCCITGQVFKDPVVAADGYTYERRSIEKWIRDKIFANRNCYVNPHKWNSPRTGEYFASDTVIPNIDMKTAIFNAREEAIKQLVKNRMMFGSP